MFEPWQMTHHALQTFLEVELMEYFNAQLAPMRSDF